MRGDGWRVTRNGEADWLIVAPDCPYTHFSGRTGPKALDITTDTGLLDAMELLAAKQGFSIYMNQNRTWTVTNGGMLDEARAWFGGTQREAIRAAWYAAVNADKERHEA